MLTICRRIKATGDYLPEEPCRMSCEEVAKLILLLKAIATARASDAKGHPLPGLAEE